MKYFITSDIHSYYTELITALNKAGFDINDPLHIFVSLGDLLDRGPDAIKCLDFVNSLPEERKILIKGNHEELLEAAIARGYFLTHDLHNGTDRTIYQLVGKTDYEESLDYIFDEIKRHKGLKKYLKSCKDYYEVRDNIFVHGWIPCVENSIYSVYTVLPNWRKKANSFDWYSARWINGMLAWKHGAVEEGKTIWCGHWHTSWGHSNLHNYGKEFLSEVETYYIDPETGKTMPFACFDPFEDEGIVAMDACTAYSHQVNVKMIEVD